MLIAIINTVVSFALNITISIVLSIFLGIIGIAIGTTTSSLLVVLLYKRAVKKCLPGLKSVFTLKYVLKLLGGLAGCLLAIAAAKLFIRSSLLSFAAATLVGFALFAALLILMNEKTIMRYIHKLKKAKKGTQNGAD
jgi:peptidoglycan biosynthesis protein MviN/MurJ (putative lipid II flippase)